MGFLYYFPGQVVCDPKRFRQHAETLERCRLTDVFRDSQISYREVTNKGPNGGSGCVVSLGEMPDDFGYHPDRQTWVEIKDVDDKTTHWLGWTVMPGPQDLLRSDAVDGHDVVMGDGNKWRIPCVHAADSISVTLPQSLRMDRHGELTAVIRPGYEAIRKEGAWWLELLSNGGQYTFGRYYEYALSLLGLCYRIGMDELNQLGLLTLRREEQSAVIFASIGAVKRVD